MIDPNVDELEAAGDALLRGTPDPERPVLNARQLRRRRQREVSLEVSTTAGLRLVDTLAGSNGDPFPPVAEWSVLDSAMDAAELTKDERSVLVAGICYELTDIEISRILGCDRRTVIRRRKTAAEKLERARDAGTGSESSQPRR